MSVLAFPFALVLGTGASAAAIVIVTAVVAHWELGVPLAAVALAACVWMRRRAPAP